MGLLSAGGRLPQAEKSRDPGAHLPLPQVYDSAERDRDHDGAALSYWHKISSDREFIYKMPRCEMSELNSNLRQNFVKLCREGFHRNFIHVKFCMRFVVSLKHNP